MSPRQVRATTTPDRTRDRFGRTLLAVSIAMLIGCSDGSKSVRDPDASEPRTEASSTMTTPFSTLPSDLSPILLAAAGRRVTADNDGVGRSFDSVAVVEVLGQGTDDGHVEFGTSSRPLTMPERATIVDGLAPRTVTFVPVDQAQSGINDGRWESALVLAVPAIESGAITVTSELWCGQQAACSDGGSVTVARNPDGSWSVTKSNGGWIT